VVGGQIGIQSVYSLFDLLVDGARQNVLIYEVACVMMIIRRQVPRKEGRVGSTKRLLGLKGLMGNTSFESSFESLTTSPSEDVDERLNEIHTSMTSASMILLVR